MVKRVDNKLALHYAALAVPRTKYGVKEAAKDAGVSEECMSLAKRILADGTSDEIRMCQEGKVSIDTLGRLIRQGVEPERRAEVIAGVHTNRIEKQQERAALYRDLKDALLKIAAMPKAADVVAATRATKRHSNDVERCLPIAIQWLKEFEHEFRSKAA